MKKNFEKYSLLCALVFLLCVITGCDACMCTLTVDPNDANFGTTSGSGDYKKGTIAIISATPKSGYRFVKWKDGDENTPRSVTVNDDATYIAIFEKIPEEKPTPTPEPEKPTYGIGYWIFAYRYDSVSSRWTIGEAVITKGKIGTAIYAPEVYVDMENGRVQLRDYKSKEVIAQKTYSKSFLEDAGLKDWNLVGWYAKKFSDVNNSDVKPYSFALGDPIVYSADTIMYAARYLSWKIEYITENGNAPKQIYVDVNTKLTEEHLPSLTADGYKFIGWYVDDKKIEVGYEITSDLKLTAKWEKITEVKHLTIRYSTDKGVTPKTLTVDGGTKLTEEHLPALSSDGFTFLGWYIDDKKVDVGYIPTGDIVLTAKWKEIVYTISYKTDYGVPPAPVTVPYGTLMTDDMTPQLKAGGYLFAGWKCDNLWSYFVNGIYSDVVLTASWIDKNGELFSFENFDDYRTNISSLLNHHFRGEYSESADGVSVSYIDVSFVGGKDTTTLDFLDSDYHVVNDKLKSYNRYNAWEYSGVLQDKSYWSEGFDNPLGPNTGGSYVQAVSIYVQMFCYNNWLYFVEGGVGISDMEDVDSIKEQVQNGTLINRNGIITDNQNIPKYICKYLFVYPLENKLQIVKKVYPMQLIK